MKALSEKFRKNGLQYQLIQRNEVAAIYGVSGTYTNKILHYEVCKIHIRDDKYGKRESLPSNGQFGRDGSSDILNLQDAKSYFEELVALIISKKEAKNNDKSGILDT